MTSFEIPILHEPNFKIWGWNWNLEKYSNRCGQMNLFLSQPWKFCAAACLRAQIMWLESQNPTKLISDSQIVRQKSKRVKNKQHLGSLLRKFQRLKFKSIRCGHMNFIAPDLKISFRNHIGRSETLFWHKFWPCSEISCLIFFSAKYRHSGKFEGIFAKMRKNCFYADTEVWSHGTFFILPWIDSGVPKLLFSNSEKTQNWDCSFSKMRGLSKSWWISNNK